MPEDLVRLFALAVCSKKVIVCVIYEMINEDLFLMSRVNWFASEIHRVAVAQLERKSERKRENIMLVDNIWFGGLAGSRLEGDVQGKSHFHIEIRRFERALRRARNMDKGHKGEIEYASAIHPSESSMNAKTSARRAREAAGKKSNLKSSKAERNLTAILVGSDGRIGAKMAATRRRWALGFNTDPILRPEAEE
ncbi:hypothetical protein C8R44DRAFT_745628 [Mycena epipterygia]|nr:hypothetical protein C8R44DRAFT_745628 [Mycena epipterygia]